MSARRAKREVFGECIARLLPTKPSCIPIGRPRGVKAQGVRYERAVASALLARWPKAGISAGPWYEFGDLNGRGYCQPDVTVYSASLDAYIVCECKLTNYNAALADLNTLYVPVLRAAHGTDVFPLIILRHLSSEVPPRSVFESFSAALYAAPKMKVPPVFHWLGRCPV